MGKLSKRGRRLILFFILGLFIWMGIWAGIIIFYPPMKPIWKTFMTESRKILGLERGGIPPEEKQIREEVILKKMEEADAHLDWRSFAPEYPRTNRYESLSQKEKAKALRESPTFKELDKEVKDYLRKKEDLFKPDLPLPPLKDTIDLTHLKDKGAEKAIERLLSPKEKAPPEKPLEENLKLGIKGPHAYRKIGERPQPLS